LPQSYPIISPIPISFKGKEKFNCESENYLSKILSRWTPSWPVGMALVFKEIYEFSILKSGRRLHSMLILILTKPILIDSTVM